MPGNEPPDPLLKLILDILRVAHEALDVRAASADEAIAEASRVACRSVEGAIVALSGGKEDA
jgi:hypothetical protein